MKKKELIQIGWREEVTLPNFTKHKIKGKIDTGARTSALHATDLRFLKKGRVEYVNFKIHPNQNSSKPSISCESRVLEMKKVKSSSGHSSMRPVIETEIAIGEETFKTEITLVDREIMGFRMLIGRKTLKNKFLVNVAKSYLSSKKGKGPHK